MIVAARRGLHGEMARLIDSLSLTVLPATESRAYDAANGYRRWGKGFQKAKLNFGECFACALASEHDRPLLFVGDDFAKADVTAAV